ncbi:MAG: adenylyltransferase/cytidyltransferase family protein [Patescibacteria group bacterium]
MTFIDLQVVATLAYTSQFQYPLSAKEVYWRLLSKKALIGFFSKHSWFSSCLEKSEKTEASCFEQVRQSLEKLVELGLLIKQGSRFTFRGDDAFFGQRVNRQAISLKRLDELDLARKFLEKNPLVTGLLLTGSEAMKNSSSVDDDLDFLVITRSAGLWMARLWVLLEAWIGGRRKLFVSPGTKIEKGAWCFNLWLDEDNLRLPSRRRSPYSAYELTQAQWLFDKGGVMNKYYCENDWTRDLLPFFPVKKELFLNKKTFKPWQIFLLLANWLVYWPERLHLQKKQSIPGRNFSLGRGFLHRDNTQRSIQRRWADIYKKQLAYLEKLDKSRRGWLAYRDRTLSAAQDVKKKVLVTGVFDVLHNEHLHFLQKARELGDWLVVGIESDYRVRQLKGEGRPVNNQRKRLRQLSKLSIADELFILPEKFSSAKDHKKLIAKIRPRYLAVSSHTPRIKEKIEILREFGGEVVVVLEQNPDVSSSKIIAQRQFNKQNSRE